MACPVVRSMRQAANSLHASRRASTCDMAGSDPLRLLVQRTNSRLLSYLHLWRSGSDVGSRTCGLQNSPHTSESQQRILENPVKRLLIAAAFSVALVAGHASVQMYLGAGIGSSKTDHREDSWKLYRNNRVQTTLSDRARRATAGDGFSATDRNTAGIGDSSNRAPGAPRLFATAPPQACPDGSTVVPVENPRGMVTRNAEGLI